MPQLYLHVSQEIHDAIEGIATEEQRTLTVVAHNLLREAIKARKDAEQAEEDTHG